MVGVLICIRGDDEKNTIDSCRRARRVCVCCAVRARGRADGLCAEDRCNAVRDGPGHDRSVDLCGLSRAGAPARRSGGAAVYDKQPLVIVNYTGDAYPEEIIGLERRIIASVKAKFDIELHPEVEHV